MEALEALQQLGQELLNFTFEKANLLMRNAEGRQDLHNTDEACQQQERLVLLQAVQ